jgi:hypothetical protein
MESGARKNVHDAVGKLSAGLVVSPEVSLAWATIRAADPAELSW